MHMGWQCLNAWKRCAPQAILPGFAQEFHIPKIVWFIIFHILLASFSLWKLLKCVFVGDAHHFWTHAPGIVTVTVLGFDIQPSAFAVFNAWPSCCWEGLTCLQPSSQSSTPWQPSPVKSSISSIEQRPTNRIGRWYWHILKGITPANYRNP